VAKRRFDQIHQQELEPDEDEIDDFIELLRAHDPTLLAQVRTLIGSEKSGIVLATSEVETLAPSTDLDPLVVRVLKDDEHGTVIAFAREGGRLAVDSTSSAEEITESCVALHSGKLVFARSAQELLRALATRSIHHATVIFLGPANDVDDELRACCISLSRVGDDSTSRPFLFAPTSEATPASPTTTVGDVRVELLRADPQITGLAEAFTPTLRRRCIEMVAYLALHRNEPITGERLRTRVLNYAKVDASSRTLANTASAVRRSLGADKIGNRLHPVTSLGLYVTHGVTSDIENFHALISKAREVPTNAAAALAREALQLVHGEPLASALRGFEWFLVEGSFAQLQRDGEWAALLVHHEAMLDEQYELAFWSLRQGLLIDPFSDALSDALSQVPRLRQFGGDRSSRAKNKAIGPSGAVMMGWSFNRLINQISQ
jgi:DNA-binding winged helix-turn-helix (wHTH) protein